jgi:serine/threonine-protein kinase TTK/MPS1
MELGETDLNHVLQAKYNINQDPELDLAFTRFYWREVLECVAAIHAHNIVHLDLKPANFVLVKNKVKLIDFGIADAINIDMTVNVQRDRHVGTLNYMSPESLQDNSVRQSTIANQARMNADLSLGKIMKMGKSSDVWSLGCICYQMVYGKAPFAHYSTIGSQALAIIDPSVSISIPVTGIGGISVPSELRQVLKACLDRDPKARPTIHHLLDEGDHWLYPENNSSIRISQDLLGQIIGNVARRFQDTTKPEPTDEEIKRYAPSFYAKIKELPRKEQL